MKNTESAPKVTVLIPVYNAERYLLETLQSVSAQTFQDIEILVIDDGSKDNSPQMLADYALTDPRLRVVRQANAGISAALNAGIAAARGEYIVRMDADDIMLPERIAAQVSFLQVRTELGFCACGMEMIDKNGRVFAQYTGRPGTVSELEAMMADQLPIVFTHPTVTYRASAVKAVGGYNKLYEPCEDMELFGRLIAAGFPGIVLPAVLMRYRVHGASISGSKVAHQVRTQDFVRASFYALRQGLPVLERSAYEQKLERAPVLERLREEAHLRSDVLQRSALYHKAEGRRFQSIASLIGAAAYRPWPAVRGVWRRLTGTDKAAQPSLASEV
ncbi:glycosyltransferase family 2 protein [Variovorax sp. HJSM1_2]|uniref:glycosyltransferase family 2 protein n=1 Tax=Variovorax sp. HJSM1_2 TaxID=3366263 RepID=UPI003BDD2FE9